MADKTVEMNLDRLMQKINDEYCFLQERAKNINLDSVSMAYQNRTVTVVRPPLQYTAAQIDSLRHQCGILVEKKIESRIPLLGPIVVFFKRVLRKMMRCYIVPIGEAQIRFNQQTINIMTGLRQGVEYQSILEDRIDEIEYLRLLEEKELHQNFEKRLMILEKENIELQMKIKLLMNVDGKSISTSQGEEEQL